jgi:2-oxoglutarate ferredoxin oxidoreductase subunit delta
MAAVTQQIDNHTTSAAVDRLSSLPREWKPVRPARHPIFPEQNQKLRDVDIVLIEDRCKGCSFCIEFCPRKVLQLSKRLNKIGIHPPEVTDSSLCVGCGVCEEICPDFAVFLVDKGSNSQESKPNGN